MTHPPNEWDAIVLRTAQQLVGFATWEYDPSSKQFTWSARALEMFDTTADELGRTRDQFFRHVHPDDRQTLSELGAATDVGGRLEAKIRIVLHDVEHVIETVAEQIEIEGAKRWLGVVRDVTDEVRRRKEAERAIALTRLAGQFARVGAWRYRVGAERVEWDDTTLAIHDRPLDRPPTVDEAIAFYAPESRATVAEAFGLCLSDGVPFDEMLHLDRPDGSIVVVRAIGEAVRDENGAVVEVHGSFQDITELVEARSERSDLDRRLSDTLEQISDAFMLIDDQWLCTFANSRCLRLVGRNRDELIGHNLWDVFPTAVGTIFQEQYERAVSTRDAVAFTAEFAELDAWFHVDAYPTDEGLAIYFREISAEREREQRLALLELTIDRQNDVLMITEAEPIDGPDHPQIVYVNEAFERKTGYRRDEALGKTPRFLQGTDTDRDELDRIRAALEKWQPVRAELINYTKDGEPFWLELDITPVSDRTGWFTHWVAVERDITERKRTESIVRGHEERFATLARVTDDVIWDWDLVTDETWHSDAYATLLGNDDTGPHTHARWRELVHPDDRARAAAALDNVRDGNSDGFEVEYRLLRADDTFAHVVHRGFVIRDDDGVARRVIGTMRDVSERRSVEERLQQSMKLEAIGQLTGGIAHDFNNLLTVILGSAELLHELIDDDSELLALVDASRKAAERGAELTNRLLAFARRQPLDARPVRVDALLEDIGSLLRASMPEHVQVEIVTRAGDWTIKVDAGQLEAAVLNLAINARDAMPDGGRLLVETAPLFHDAAADSLDTELSTGDYVVMSVSDDGAGMSDAVVERAFEPFFTTKDRGTGSGLGLSMVYGFVKQSGGHARISSETGKGTTVRLYFPRSEGEETLHEESNVAPTVAPTGDEHVLVVEDDDQVRSVVTTFLGNLGYRVSAARSGVDALAIFDESDDVDLLFTDVVMPGGMNGRELAEEVRRRSPATRLLFTSGYTDNVFTGDDPPDLEGALLNKPYRRQALAEHIRALLDDERHEPSKS